MGDLFDPGPRTDNAPRRYSESEYDFLNRVAGVVFDRVRGLLEEWFEAFPTDHRSDLLPRLRSNDDTTFRGAFWELYLYRMFTLLDWQVEVHPEVSGSTHRPDFLVTPTSGDPFYVEATVVAPSLEKRAAQKRLAVVFDALNKLPSPSFWLSVEVEAQGSNSPPLGRLIGDVRKWLDGLDADQILREGVELHVLDRYALVWRHEGWRIEFRPLPKPPEVRPGGGRTVGMSSEGAGFINTTNSLRQAVRSKAGRYGALDRPYLIAALIVDDYAELGDVIGSLFGTVAIRIAVGPIGAAAPETFRQRDGAWQGPGGPVNTRVSGVITVANLGPGSVARRELRLWLNPWAARPMTADLPIATTSGDDATGMLSERPAQIAAAKLFGLPEDWPGPEDPFPDDA
jgi:hypothetical protein